MPSTQPSSFDLVDAELSARAELNEIAKVILRDQAVRREVFDLALQPRFIDLYVDLDDLLNPAADPADEYHAVPTRGSFRAAFDGVYDPTVHTALATTLTPSGLNARSGQLDGSGLFLYCPYCEDYTATQMEGTFSVAVDTSVDLSDDVQTVVGTEFSTGGETLTTISDDYMVGTPTLLVIGEPDGGLQGFVEPPPSGPFDEPFDPFEPKSYDVTRCLNDTCCVYTIFVWYVNEESRRSETKRRCYPDPNGSGGGTSNNAWEDCDNTTGVWTGVIQVKKQWDNPFKGGPEMRLGRIGSENVSSVNGRQITAAGWSKFMRKDLRRRDVKEEYIVDWPFSFDDEWQCEDLPQHVIYYEEDDDTKTTYKASVTVKAKVSVTLLGQGITFGPGEATLGVEHERSSDDDLLFAEFFDRNEFFRWNTVDNGCGLHEGWRKYACENDDGFFTLPSRF